MKMVDNAIYLDGEHAGWVINMLVDGIEVISPGVGELVVEQTHGNAVTIVERNATTAPTGGGKGEG